MNSDVVADSQREAGPPTGDMVSADGPGQDKAGGRRLRGLRSGVSVVLLVLAAVAAVAGGATLYARDELVNPSAFANRAVTASHEPAVQRVIAREITVQVLEPAYPDLIAGRPLVQSAVRLLVTSKPFGAIIRLAAVHGHRLLFQRNGGNAVFDMTDAGLVVTSVLRNLAPQLAKDLPGRTEAILLTFKKRSFATQTLRIADTIRVLGLILPAAALVLFGLGLAIAPERRTAIARGALAVGVAAAFFALALELLKRYAVAHVQAPPELNGADVRAAVGELWGAFLGDLMIWALVVSGVGLILAVAASPLQTAYSPAAGLAWLRGVVRRPLSKRGRGIRGAAVGTAGLVVLLDPSLALRVVVIVGGILLLYAGAGELMTATAPVTPRPKRQRQLRPRRVAVAGALAAVCVAAVVFALGFTGATSNVTASSVRACNGYAQLCDRRLDEVVFVGTHNSMSAADTPGWLIPNQDRDIAQQLNDGMRVFKISTHYGVETPSGRVYTDIAGEGIRLNRVSAKLAPFARAALQRFSRSLNGGSPRGKRQIWLCHTLCELGATNMIEYLNVIRRFLDLNPDQVIILFDEDYVAERDLQKAFEEAGLFDRLATLHYGQPLPTLGDLIRSRHNIVVFAQKPVSGGYAWNTPGFNWIQDTLLGAKKPNQFTCKSKRGEQLSRGASYNPLLMMNNWADVFPPRPTPNIPLVQKAFILKRAQECIGQRGRIPNLILTDYYDRGQVAAAGDELNGVANVKPAPIKPVASSG
jgi:hypothetical protein